MYGSLHLPEFLKQEMLSFINRANGGQNGSRYCRPVYNRICELGSLSAAARALGISRPMVSRYLEQMEKWAGARLVNRSTRKLTLTAAGEKVLQKTRTLSQISQEIEDQSVKDLPSGTLRVACAHFTAMQIIARCCPICCSVTLSCASSWMLTIIR